MLPKLLLPLLLLAVGLAPATAAPDTPRPAKKPRFERQRPIRVPRGAKGHANLEYGSSGEVTLRLDVYTPDPAGDAPRPLVVWIHGGGWRGGNKENTRATRLVARGYVVASIRYRLSHEDPFPAQIEDCKAAIRWLRSHAKRFGVDPDRIGVWGSSAGGHLAALLGTAGDVSEFDGMSNTLTASSRVQAVCDFFGPSDLTATIEPEFRPHRGQRSEAIDRLLGGSPEEKTGLASLASPLTHVSKDDPPFLICHGTEDRLVPLEQSRRLHAALIRAGVDSTLLEVEGAGHGLKGRAVDRAVDAFFDRVLGPVPPVAGKTIDPVFEKRRFASSLLDRKETYHVHVPAEHAGGDRRYPVIYWLHDRGGASGDGIGFVRRIAREVREGRMPPVIVVSVNGARAGCYCDADKGRAPLESMILTELIPHVDATYRTIARREGRAIEGFGMGGFGALHLAFKRPDLFVAATGLAGDYLTAEEFAAAQAREYRKVFGGSPERYRAENPLALVESRAHDLRGRVSVRLVAGEKDPGLRAHWRMLAGLARARIPHRAMLLAETGHDREALYARLGARTAGFYREIFATVSEEESGAR